jgi:hypothetical protein
MPTYPADRFDRPPADLQRVGAHRAPRPAGRGWVAFAWAAAATVLLISLGVVAMFVINNRVSFGGAGAPQPADTTAVPTPTVQPTVDPAVNVVILNGTPVNGLAGQVGDVLAKQGWKVGSRSNASASNVATSAIFYTDPAQEGAARGLSAALGGMRFQLSNQYLVPGENRITILIGADYKPAA